jgi:hypothetical protein
MESCPGKSDEQQGKDIITMIENRTTSRIKSRMKKKQP